MARSDVRAKDGTYEYIAVDVDDLCIAAHDPKGIVDVWSGAVVVPWCGASECAIK